MGVTNSGAEHIEAALGIPPRPTLKLPGDEKSYPLPPHGFVTWPKTVWHYTDAGGALGAIEKKALWASKASMLNDASEISFGREVIESAFLRWDDRAAAGVVHDALRQAIDNLPDLISDRAPFVLSASGSERLLNQWMNYADTAGYALGLSTVPLTVSGYTVGHASARPMLTPLWLAVVYQPTERDTYVWSVLDGIVDPGGAISRAFEIDADGERHLEDNLAILAASMKDEAFAAEEEVRFVVTAPSPDLIKYRAMRRGIVPYLELISAADPAGKGSKTVNSGKEEDRSHLPIMEVVVGPPEASAQRRIDVLEGMRDCGIAPPFRVRSASIPYVT